ncbi:hypothetical protein AB0F96_38075 [Streptomyces sp. NPDC023998]|uniref:hypothetical protein n=1 Tax=Streptomyces sp. NPDC023998 TaxID=3154597 RepID=UPI0034062E26
MIRRGQIRVRRRAGPSAHGWSTAAWILRGGQAPCPYAAPKGQDRWTSRWKTALNAFDSIFDGRLSAARQ